MGGEAIGLIERSPLLRRHYTHAVARRLLRRDDWLMLPGERAALEGVLSFVEPHLSIEIGTHSGGSLESISAHSAEVHSFDLASHPAVTKERFPNVEFHIGDSHELLPLFLKELEQSGGTVDFAFVDGDHSAAGVRRDVVDLLGSSCMRETVILLHDTLNADVRAGLELVDFSTYDSVCFVDLDLVHGRVAKKGQGANKLLWGLGMVVTGDRLDAEWPTHYSARELYADFSRSLLGSGAIDEPFGHSQLVELHEEVARLKSAVQRMERSASWRVTRPLRDIKTRVHGLRHRRGAASS
jgi:Methyltransferase domain